jgi:hypothetical protein
LASTRQQKGTASTGLQVGTMEWVSENIDNDANAQWDGKLGIWPIGKYKAAERNSKHRPAGTMEWVSENIDNENYRDMLVNQYLVIFELFIFHVSQQRVGGDHEQVAVGTMG